MKAKSPSQNAIVTYFLKEKNLMKVGANFRPLVADIAFRGTKYKLTDKEYQTLMKAKHYIDGNWQALKSPKWNK